MPALSPRPPAVDRLLVLADRWAAAGRPAMADAARRAAEPPPLDPREPAPRASPDTPTER